MSVMFIVEDSFSLRLWRNMLWKTGELAERMALWARRTLPPVLMVTSACIDSSSMRERHRRVLCVARDCIAHSLGHMELASPPCGFKDAAKSCVKRTNIYS